MFPEVSPTRKGWGCFLFASCQMRGHFKRTVWRAWHILWSLRDTGTGVWLPPKSLKTTRRWPAPWEDEPGFRMEWLARPKLLSSCGPDVVLKKGVKFAHFKKESSWREPLEAGDDINGGEPGVGIRVTREGVAYRGTSGERWWGWIESGEPRRKHVWGKLLPEDTSTRWQVCHLSRDSRPRTAAAGKRKCVWQIRMALTVTPALPQMGHAGEGEKLEINWHLKFY